MLYDKEINIYPAYISECNLNDQKQIILLISPNLKRMSISCSKKIVYNQKLLRKITSKNNGNFSCLNFIYSFTTKANLNRIKR